MTERHGITQNLLVHQNFDLFLCLHYCVEAFYQVYFLLRFTAFNFTLTKQNSKIIFVILHSGDELKSCLDQLCVFDSRDIHHDILAQEFRKTDLIKMVCYLLISTIFIHVRGPADSNHTLSIR